MIYRMHALHSDCSGESNRERGGGAPCATQSSEQKFGYPLFLKFRPQIFESHKFQELGRIFAISWKSEISEKGHQCVFFGNKNLGSAGSTQFFELFFELSRLNSNST